MKRMWGSLKAFRLTHSQISALIIAGVSSMVLLAYHLVNPDREAEKYFLSGKGADESGSSEWTYRVMEACYIVILGSAAFNFRYVVFDVVGSAVRQHIEQVIGVGAPMAKGAK